MNLSGLMDSVRNALGMGAAKPAAPAPRAAAPTPAPAPRPAPVAPSPIAAAPVTPAPAAAGSATLVRAVRAGGRVLAAGTAVKVVAVHSKGTAYTVQVPGLATAKTIEGAAVRVG